MRSDGTPGRSRCRLLSLVYMFPVTLYKYFDNTSGFHTKKTLRVPNCFRKEVLTAHS